MSACGRVGIHSCLLSDFPTFCISRALVRKYATWGEKLRQFLCESMALSQARKIY